MAAAAITEALNVPEWLTFPVPNLAIRSARPATALTGQPPASALPYTARSGVTPKCRAAPPSASRNPVMTSSKTSTAPARSVSSRTRSRKPALGGMAPALHIIGSQMTAAISAPCRSNSAVRASASLKGTTSQSARAPATGP